jgi:hypothetical protein
MSTVTSAAQIRISRTSPAYWRITFDIPPGATENELGAYLGRIGD